MPTRHGIPSSYNRGCRCQECREANTRRMRRGGYNEAHRRRNYAARVLVDGRWVAERDGRHGERETYNRFGCRCVPCTEANTVFLRARREADVA